MQFCVYRMLIGSMGTGYWAVLIFVTRVKMQDAVVVRKKGINYNAQERMDWH